MLASLPTAETPSQQKQGAIQTEPARCCLCGQHPQRSVAVGLDFEYAISDDVWRMDRCDPCGVLILNPRPFDSEFDRVYPPNYHAFQFDEKQFGLVHRIRQWLEARRLLSLFQDLPANARIVDVGCGDGFHLSLLKQFGPQTWQVEGIDASERAVAQAQRRGLTVTCGTVESCVLPAESLDAVLMIMTVEHLSHPEVTVSRVAQLLKPGGRLVIVTDNANSIDAWLFGKRTWGGYHFPRHTYLFNRGSLAKLADKTGLSVARIRTIVSPVNWVFSIRNWLVDRHWPQWIVNRFSLSTPISLTAFTMLDNILSVMGRGAILQAVFQKPHKG
ncbi:MAG: class I SAM-dependent methyltransferase [Gemmataceae bacterium]